MKTIIILILFNLSVNSIFSQNVDELNYITYPNEGFSQISIYRVYDKMKNDTILFKKIIFDSIGRIKKELYGFNNYGNFIQKDYEYDTKESYCVRINNPFPIKISNITFSKKLNSLINYSDENKVEELIDVYEDGKIELQKFSYITYKVFAVRKFFYENNTLIYTDFYDFGKPQ